jgi:hypothetical protein
MYTKSNCPNINTHISYFWRRARLNGWKHRNIIAFPNTRPKGESVMMHGVARETREQLIRVLKTNKVHILEISPTWAEDQTFITCAID